MFNIYKAEGLPNENENEAATSFISVRTQGYVQQTKTINKNKNPNYLAKFHFPVYTPTYNDKITIRLWSCKPGR